MRPESKGLRLRSQMAGRPQQLSTGAYVGTACENIVIMLGDIFQDAPVKIGCSRDGQPSIRLEQVDTRPSFSVKHLRAANLILQEAAPSPIHHLVVEVSLGEVERGQLIGRKVHPTRSPILPYIPQDIGQLQRHAHLDRIGNGLRVGEADDVHAHQADRGGHPVAIFGQVFKGPVSAGKQVQAHAVDELLGV